MATNTNNCFLVLNVFFFPHITYGPIYKIFGLSFLLVRRLCGAFFLFRQLFYLDIEAYLKENVSICFTKDNTKIYKWVEKYLPKVVNNLVCIFFFLIFTFG